MLNQEGEMRQYIIRLEDALIGIKESCLIDESALSAGIWRAVDEALKTKPKWLVLARPKKETNDDDS